MNPNPKVRVDIEENHIFRQFIDIHIKEQNPKHDYTKYKPEKFKFIAYRGKYKEGEHNKYKINKTKTIDELTALEKSIQDDVDAYDIRLTQRLLDSDLQNPTFRLLMHEYDSGNEKCRVYHRFKEDWDDTLPTIEEVISEIKASVARRNAPVATVTAMEEEEEDEYPGPGPRVSTATTTTQSNNASRKHKHEAANKKKNESSQNVPKVQSGQEAWWRNGVVEDRGSSTTTTTTTTTTTRRPEPEETREHKKRRSAALKATIAKLQAEVEQVEAEAANAPTQEVNEATLYPPHQSSHVASDSDEDEMSTQ